MPHHFHSGPASRTDWKDWSQNFAKECFIKEWEIGRVMRRPIVPATDHEWGDAERSGRHFDWAGWKDRTGFTTVNQESKEKKKSGQSSSTVYTTQMKRIGSLLRSCWNIDDRTKFLSSGFRGSEAQRLFPTEFVNPAVVVG